MKETGIGPFFKKKLIAKDEKCSSLKRCGDQKREHVKCHLARKQQIILDTNVDEFIPGNSAIKTCGKMSRYQFHCLILSIFKQQCNFTPNIVHVVSSGRIQTHDLSIVLLFP